MKKSKQLALHQQLEMKRQKEGRMPEEGVKDEELYRRREKGWKTCSTTGGLRSQRRGCKGTKARSLLQECTMVGVRRLGGENVGLGDAGMGDVVWSVAGPSHISDMSLTWSQLGEWLVLRICLY